MGSVQLAGLFSRVESSSRRLNCFVGKMLRTAGDWFRFAAARIAALLLFWVFPFHNGGQICGRSR